MKSFGILESESGLWFSPNVEASNVSGFSALPGGLAIQTEMIDLGLWGYWWSTTVSDLNGSLGRSLDNLTGYLDSYYANNQIGLSVRCLRD
jgi:uncharacterized protein (TIGR02145 family)